MKIRKATIRLNETGWVVYFDNEVENFYLFTSGEPERFVKFIAEKVGNIKIDALLKMRDEEIERTRKQFDNAEK